MEKIVVIWNSEPRTTSYSIARGFKREHKDVLKLIKKYKSSIEKFGNLPLEKVKVFKEVIGDFKSLNSTAKQNEGKESNKISKVNKNKTSKRTIGRPIKAYFLNEAQATFLVTLFANSKIVVDFKQTLVQEFYKHKKILEQVINNKQNSEWARKRIEGKKRRIEQTTKIKDFITYAKNQGSKNADWYYTIFTTMQNNALFIVEGKFKNLREVMSPEQLMVIGVADGIVKKTITEGMNKGLFYKEIFKKAKANMILFAELHGQNKIIEETKKLQEPD